MNESYSEPNHTLTKKSESGSPVTPPSTADFPDEVTLLFLPELTGTCTIISNADLSLVDPLKIPRPTLEFIRLAEEQSKRTQAEILEQYSVKKGYNDIFQTHRFEEKFVKELRPAIRQANRAAGSEGVKYGDLPCRRVLDLVLDREPPEWNLVKDGPRGYTSIGGSVETAYNAYLASCADKEQERSEGLPKEAKVLRTPQLATGLTTSEVAKPFDEETTTMNTTLSTTFQIPQVPLSSSPRSTGQTHEARRPRLHAQLSSLYQSGPMVAETRCSNQKVSPP